MTDQSTPGFPILKHRLISMPQGNLQNDVLVNFNNPFLIVGLHCPEITEAFEREFMMINLKPYELAVNRFSGSDFLYDLSALSSAGQRSIKRCDLVYNNTFNGGTDVIIVVSYLEFHT